MIFFFYFERIHLLAMLRKMMGKILWNFQDRSDVIQGIIGKVLGMFWITVCVHKLFHAPKTSLNFVLSRVLFVGITPLITSSNVSWYCKQFDKIQIYHRLTHLPMDKMAAIQQTIFSDAFSWMKSSVFWLKFHSSLFLRVQLTMT